MSKHNNKGTLIVLCLTILFIIIMVVNNPWLISAFAGRN